MADAAGHFSLRRDLLRPWRRAGLRTKMLLSYVALISIPLLVVALAAYQTSTDTIKQNAQNFSAQLTGEVRDNLDTYAQEAQRLTYWPFQALAVQQVLRLHQRGPAGPPRFAEAAVVRQALSRLGHERPDLAGIYAITGNGTLFSWTASGDLRPHPRTLDAPWYGLARQRGSRPIFLPTGSQEMISVATGKVFSLVRALRDSRTGAALGAVRIDIDAEALASVVRRVRLGTQGRLLVFTPTGELVYPIDPTAEDVRQARRIAARGLGSSSGRFDITVGGQALLATYDTSSQSGWIVAGVVPTAYLLSGVDHLRTLILTVAALCILAGMLCAGLVLGKLTRPLRQLRAAMSRVEARGDLDTRLIVSSEDEVGQLAHSFNTMLDELRRLVDDVLRAQIHEREAELRALQNQINPHFLYNALESINMLAITHGDRDISRMVTALGRLLRLSISSTEILVPLANELEYLQHYLTVQRMRYGDRLAMQVEVEAELLPCVLPKFTLQPLVENALVHGLETRRGIGKVIVRGRREGDDLVLTVEDDGLGMESPTLFYVRAGLGRTPDGDRSVGLANVHQRLKLHCGPAYGLVIDSERGVGTRVTVRVPSTVPDGDAPAAPPGHGKELNVDASLTHRR